MDEFKIVYQDRILKVTRCLTEKGCKYKIEITNGLFSQSWEKYFSNDGEAIRSANQKFSNLSEKMEVAMAGKSKQEIEFAVSAHLSKFLKEQMGEQAKTLTTELLENTIIVRLKDMLSPAERCLIKDWEGLRLIKELKGKLMEGSKDNLKTMIKDLTGVDAVDIHTSFNMEHSELIIVFSMAKNLGKSI